MALTGYISTSALAPTLRNTPGPTTSEYNRVIVQYATATVAVGTLNTLYNMMVLPKNAVVVQAWIRSADIDGDASPTVVLALGDSGDDDRLVTGYTGGQTGAAAAGTLAATGLGYKYTADTLIQLKLTTAAATIASGAVVCGVAYFVDNAATT